MYFMLKGDFSSLSIMDFGNAVKEIFVLQTVFTCIHFSVEIKERHFGIFIKTIDAGSNCLDTIIEDRVCLNNVNQATVVMISSTPPS